MRRSPQAQSPPPAHSGGAAPSVTPGDHESPDAPSPFHVCHLHVSGGPLGARIPGMTSQEASGSAMGRVDRTGRSDGLEHLARVGLIAYGIVHLLLAWLVLQLAWFGGSGQSADQSGAMGTLARQPFGKPLLWILALGLVELAVWQAAEVLRGRSGWWASGKTRTKAIKKSANAGIKAAVYAAFAVVAIRFAVG